MMHSNRALAILTLPFRNSYIFLLCVTLLFMQLGLHAGSKSRDRTSAEVFLGSTPEIQDELLSRSMGARQSNHPISKLMEEAEERYRSKVGKQSRSLKAAVAEYKKRYKRPPPAGFDEWWKFAKRHDVKLVDEYDGLVADLVPFWDLSGVELRRRAAQAGEIPFVDLVRLRKGKSESVNLRGEGVSGRAEGFRRMISRFVDKLPDMDFPINSFAESRVLVPWEHQRYPNMTRQDSSAGLNAMLGGPFQADWGAEETIWNAWRRTCNPSSIARRIFTSIQSGTSSPPFNYFDPDGLPSGDDFNFVPSPSATHDDYCSTPHLHLEEGMFYSDWRTIHALYPIFSPAKGSGYSDIRIPSHYYFGNTPGYTYGWDYVNLEMKDVDSMEVPWEKKKDKVFWRGASSGGGNHPPRHANKFHRHRFVRMASDYSGYNRTITFPDPTNPSQLITSSVPIDELNSDVMDVAFVKAASPEIYPGGETALKEQNRFEDSVPLGQHWSYKYLMDLDGVAYSGKFMAFLASDSVPLKATVYKEFYEDWIEPWLHYIPISSSFQEVYNVHAYFSGPPKPSSRVIHREGDSSDGSDEQSGSSPSPLETRRFVEADRQLRRVARAGKQWKKKVGRHVDIEVYVYRLCLEWARLLADDRDSMGYSYFKLI